MAGRGPAGQDASHRDAALRGRSRPDQRQGREGVARVKVGDRVEARIADRDRVVEVVTVIESRVGAPVAVTCYVDHSPAPAVEPLPPGMEWARGAGRPSKRVRRELDRMRRGG